MIKAKMRGNETAEQMLRRFKKMCEKEGLTKDIKRVAYYEKPSEKRRRRQRKGPRIGGPMRGGRAGAPRWVAPGGGGAAGNTHCGFGIADLIAQPQRSLQSAVRDLQSEI